MSFYPKELQEEALKQRVAKDFFASFVYEPLERVDFTLKNKDADADYVLWAEAKAGDEADIYESLVQLLLTIGVQKLHKNFVAPDFLAAFDCAKIAFVPYGAVKDFLYSGDFNWKKITPSDHKSAEFQKMLALTKGILQAKRLVFDYESEREELKEFVKNSLATGEHNPIEIDADNFNEVYLKWCNQVLPNINLQNEMWKKARKQNIALESDFFLADLISEDNVSLAKNLRILLQKKADEELYYKVKTEENALFGGQFNQLEIECSDKNAHSKFWKRYKRPPKEKFWREIYERRDKITPHDIMERKGAFFTPKIWVQKAHDYLKSALGENWQEEYYIWDCAAGTGNLLKGLTNSARIYASTLDLSDVLIMKDLCEFDRNDTEKKPEQKLNLLERHIFAFDFLNDEFSKCPPTLQEILKDEKKREKLIIFINPPYAEAGTKSTTAGTGQNKDGVALGNKIYEKYKENLGKASNELFAQFFMRIYKEIPNCVLASFSTLKYINSANFVKFRESFKAEFLKGFICPADTFDNVKGEFPIGFLIWDLKAKNKFKEIHTDVFTSSGKFARQKGFYADLKTKTINQWLKEIDDKGDKIGILMADAPDFQNNNHIGIMSNKTKGHWIFRAITSANLIPFCVYFAVRQAIEASWLNDRDQFLYPNDKWQEDGEFSNDCLAFALFHGQNKISSEGDKNFANHFIPFTESEVGAKEAFASSFMTNFINGKFGKNGGDSSLRASKSERGNLQNKERDCHEVVPTSRNDGIDDLFGDELKPKNFVPATPLQFSKEAKAVFDAGREIWRYYHSCARSQNYNANASLYDIKEFFQGRNEKGRMNPKSKDETYNDLMAALRLALKELAEKIAPKIYEYGFLKE